MSIHSLLPLTALTALAFAGTACAPLGEPGDPAPPGSVIDLDSLLGPSAPLSGIAVDPETGERYVLEAERGIYRLEDDGTLTHIWTRDPSLPRLNDLCAIGGGRFVAAADGDGYIVDVAAGAARQHFCLEPGWNDDFAEPDAPMRHINSAVACDLDAGLIYGQPSSVPTEGEPRITRHEVASYLLTTGADQQWLPLPLIPGQAGGMTLVESGVLLMGWGTALKRFDVRSGLVDAEIELERYGVSRIEGIAFDRRADVLLVLDAAGQLTELPSTAVPWF